MPILTIIVPAYNADRYLHRALSPFARALTGTDVEVIVVDDGSTDATATIAAEYAARYPTVFRVVTQANAGHGGAINAGIAAATGTYLKVLDADDWLDTDVLDRVVRTLEALEPTGGVDAFFSDYVHERIGKENRTMRFESVFPSGRVFAWDESDRFGRRQYLMMHAVIFRTSVVRASQLKLPEHTFYVDSLFVLIPLAHTRRLYYSPETLYHYFIGRPDQSVDVDVMVRRVDQQLFVNRLALKTLPPSDAVMTGEIPAALYDCLLHYVEALCAITSATLVHCGTPRHLVMRRSFWHEVRNDRPRVYRRMRRGLMGASSNLPGVAGRRVTLLAYGVARRVVGFS
ncbi:glycosyltransferase family 2 protein [Agromyces atrinae]|uniref:glycosyltransferase family 2 protein n=1 Tax=Agromyces atrinae TaxID=592376 RepID=UPI001F5AB7C2|nr:glycosyltransferase family A protein [Agromyces atrinae]MCI2956859.1 glycosyltransferase family 2 protein [Agromyces atrinae]